jgi:hypothetical protein
MTKQALEEAGKFVDSLLVLHEVQQITPDLPGLLHILQKAAQRCSGIRRHLKASHVKSDTLRQSRRRFPPGDAMIQGITRWTFESYE